jgi:hypothetical protein
MSAFKSAMAKIPWNSFGRPNKISKLAKCIVPVGNHSRAANHVGGDLMISSNDPDYENFILESEGTAFRVGHGKFMTCKHVAEVLDINSGLAFFQADTTIEGRYANVLYPIQGRFDFFDSRNDGRKNIVDASILISLPISTNEQPYLVEQVRWGDSSKLGVGDKVLIGGFPLGKEMFLSGATNRAIVQPTFFDGIISAIIPAARPGENRLLQISTVALGGISGGVVCMAATGEVVGMVMSNLTTDGGVPLPITYAIPSEILRPWADAVKVS